VLFVHGISTSCVTLGRIAEGLVARGCRVLLFDLFGRGFSDGVGDLPHDERLYLSQMLFVLASSPLSWTGSDATAIRVVGYSLGGGIAVHFANAFPDLVESLVLLAPAGLINPASFGLVSRFFFSSGLVPERILAVLTRRRLQQPIASQKAPRPSKFPAPQVIELAASEAADPPPGQPVAPIEQRVLEYVRWMVINHDGFVPAFMSSVRFAPLTHQHESWRQLARRPAHSTIVMLAETDEIIDVDDYAREAMPIIGGPSHVHWKVFPGGHDFVMTHAQLILEELGDKWKMKA
jgi:pimeloyl-ACP methyl ester carboxylesterase